MSWGGETPDVHITNIWSHGFINTYSFTNASKQRLRGLCTHLDSLDHVIYYKITRDDDGEVLYEHTKENEFARRYFAGVKSATDAIARANRKAQRGNQVAGGSSSSDERTSSGSNRRSSKKSKEA